MSFKLELLRAESDHPVPSHGGPAFAVTWSLTVNDVVIRQEYDRYPWVFNPIQRAKLGEKPPAAMRALYEELDATR